jgi:eukaryotic-like serine/threonine-protein kinase
VKPEADPTATATSPYQSTISLAPGSLPRADDTLPLVAVPEEHYQVIGEQGRGGIGLVLRARDRRLGREVALKQLQRGGNLALERFEREMRITARLQHPGVVPVHEAGCFPSGTPFYAMKLIEGRSLRECIAAAAGLDERLALLRHVLAVAETVAYAHSRGVIHRDLKPANIIVGAYGEAVVIDWGLAKDLGEPSRDGDSTGEAVTGTLHTGEPLTVAGQVVGTPGYMAPEQAMGGPVDQRADVWALGAVLYHVLAGEPAYAGASSDDILRRVRQGPPTPLAQLVPTLPAELAAIVVRAMARDPRERYAHAGELAEDLRRFATGQLVAAHRYTPVGLALRWLRRHRGAVVVALVSAALLLGTGVISLRNVLASRATAVRERGQAERARVVAESSRRDLQLAQAQEILRRDPTMALAWLRAYLDDGGDARRAAVLAADAWSRGVAWRVLAGHSGMGSRVAFLPDGKQLASASWDGTIRVWDLEAATSRVLRGHGGRVYSLAVSHDGKRLASHDSHGELAVWDVASGTGRVLSRAVFPHSRDPMFTGDDRAVLVQGQDQRLHLVDVESGADRVLPDAIPFLYVLSEDGGRIALVGEDGVTIYDVASERRTPVCHGNTAQVIWTRLGQLVVLDRDGTMAMFDASGKLLAQQAQKSDASIAWADASDDGRRVVRARRVGNSDLLEHWNIQTGELKLLAQGPRQYKWMHFAPDGEHVFTIDNVGQLTRWQLSDGSHVTLPSEDQDAKYFALARDGQRAATIGYDGVVRVWNLDAGLPRNLGPYRPGGDFALSPDGKRLATIGAGKACVIDVATGAYRCPGDFPVMYKEDYDEAQRPRSLVVWAPDGESVAASDLAGGIHIYAASGAGVKVVPSHDGRISNLLYSADGRTLVSGGRDGKLRFHDVASGKAAVVDVGSSVRALALDRDVVATGDHDGRVRLWNLRTHEPIGAPLAGDSEVLALAFSPDGRRIAAGLRSGAVDVWDIATGAGRTFAGHLNWVTVVAWAPDGKRLASGSGDDTVRVWDLESGDVRVLAGHRGFLRALAWSADGTRLASGADDDKLRLWYLATGDAREIQTADDVFRVTFMPEGNSVLAGAFEAKLVRDDVPSDRAGLRAWIDAHTNMRLAETR